MVAIHPCFAVVPSFWQSSSDIQFQSAYQTFSPRSAHSPFSSLKDIKGNLPAKSTGPVKPAKQKSSLKSSGAAGGGNEGGKLQGKKNGTSSNGGKASSTANGSASSQSSPVRAELTSHQL
eukprot:jgi/Mesen1/2644/ME000166S01766